MKLNYSLLLTGIFGLLCSSTAMAQNVRMITLAPDGQEISIPLSAQDQGRDIVLVAETTNLSAQRVSVTLGGPPGIGGRVLSQMVGKGVTAQALPLDTGWTPINLRYPGAAFRSGILVGESTTSGGGGGGCPPWMSPQIIASFLAIYRALPEYGPNFTEAQLCALIGSDPTGSGGQGGTSGDPSELTPASGAILRDACSSDYKLAVQFRISLAGQPSSTFNGSQSIRASLKLAKSKVVNSGTMKAAQGRDGAGAWIYLAPAIKVVLNEQYGAPGSDKLTVQRYRNGKPNMTKVFKTRPLWGSVIYDISPVQSVLKGSGKLTFTTQNEDEVYSRCVPAKKQRWFFGDYKKRHGIHG